MEKDRNATTVNNILKTYERGTKQKDAHTNSASQKQETEDSEWEQLV